MTPPPAPNFDRIAAIYRWAEYLSLGPLLQRTRTTLLSHLEVQLNDPHSALVLGDGDGRFLEQLFLRYPQCRALAVDTSAAMLQRLRNRCTRSIPHAATRLTTLQRSALDLDAPPPIDLPQPDLIATHFFLDCLTQPQLETLARNLAHHAQPQALWLLSDFRIPSGPMRLPARALVRSLYLAFRLLTGLRVTQLPDHAAALTAVGFTRIAQHYSLAGILTAELWAFTPDAAQPAYTPAMLLPTQRARDAAGPPDPVPNPEPASPSLPEPDPGVFHPDPAPSAPPPKDINPACA
jgi:hypothetical protein